MRKTKKLLSLILAVAMLLSLGMPSAFAADFTDVSQGYQYYDAIQSLVGRGVINGYEDGSFKPESTITRAEFAKMVIYSIGLGDISQGAGVSSGFPDVPAEHWAAGVIRTAFDMKIINGFEDGTFRPDENVTYDQAIKMVVCAKYDKFGEAALKNGGYPTGYRKVANSYGFLKSITDGVYDAAAKRGTVAQLMHNMINIKLSTVTNDPTAVETSKVTELKGQVVAVYGASLESTVSELTKYQIRVMLNSGAIVTYDASALAEKESLRNYLGKLVTVYYTNDMGLEIQNLSSLTLQRGRNEELTIDMLNVIPSSSDTRLSYSDENGDIEDISISNNAKILYNGSLVTDGTTFNDLLSANVNSAGSIRLLATAGQGSAADVVFFTVYSNFIVTSTNSSSKTVFLDNGEKVVSKVIDDEDRSKSVSIIKNGSNVTFSAIAKGQVLSISEDLTGNFIEVLVGPAAFEGRVSAMTRDEGLITINSKEYRFAPGVAFGDDIVIGANLKVYLDAFNKIAKYEFKATAVSYYYAYLTQVKDIGNGISSDIRAELIDLKSTNLKSFTTYPLADNVKINNQNYKTANDFDLILAALQEAAQRSTYVDPETDKIFGAEDGDVHQPIKYTLNNGKIDSILIAKEGATDADIRVDATMLNVEKYPQGIKCTTQYTGLAGIYNLSGSTKVLYVSDTTKRALTDYNIKAGNNSGLQLNQYYRLVFVDMNSSGTPAAVIVYNINNIDVDATTNDWTNSLPVVVTKKTTIQDYNLITVQGYSGSEKSYKDEGTEFYDQVALGDIIRVTADSDSLIEDLEVVAKAAEISRGTNFIKLGEHQQNFANNQKITNADGQLLLIREGDYVTQDKATMSTMAGTVYSLINNTLRVALDYTTPDDTEVWDEILLGQEGQLQQMAVSSSTKVISVNFSNGSVQSIDKAAVIDEIIPYVLEGQTSTNGAAERVFVYRSGSNARMIVVYRNN